MVVGSQDVAVFLLTQRAYRPHGHAAFHARLSRNDRQLSECLLTHYLVFLCANWQRWRVCGTPP